MPLLNPDGVARGHYRTDQTGTNLNRVYLKPDFNVHPTIYAIKSLLVFHHINNRISKEHDGLNFDDTFKLEYDTSTSSNLDEKHVEPLKCDDSILELNNLNIKSFDEENKSARKTQSSSSSCNSSGLQGIYGFICSIFIVAQFVYLFVPCIPFPNIRTSFCCF